MKKKTEKIKKKKIKKIKVKRKKKKKLTPKEQEILERRKEKGCYGTNEYSNKSAICKKCKWVEGCFEVEKKETIKKIKGERR